MRTINGPVESEAKTHREHSSRERLAQKNHVCSHSLVLYC